MHKKQEEEKQSTHEYIPSVASTKINDHYVTLSISDAPFSTSKSASSSALQTITSVYPIMNNASSVKEDLHDIVSGDTNTFMKKSIMSDASKQEILLLAASNTAPTIVANTWTGAGSLIALQTQVDQAVASKLVTSVDSAFNALVSTPSTYVTYLLVSDSPGATSSSESNPETPIGTVILSDINTTTPTHSKGIDSTTTASAYQIAKTQNLQMSFVSSAIVEAGAVSKTNTESSSLFHQAALSISTSSDIAVVSQQWGATESFQNSLSPSATLEVSKVSDTDTAKSSIDGEENRQTLNTISSTPLETSATSYRVTATGGLQNSLNPSVTIVENTGPSTNIDKSTARLEFSPTQTQIQSISTAITATESFEVTISSTSNTGNISYVNLPSVEHHGFRFVE